ncbi:MAG: GyrI-like domain-containing protein [Anaerolineales bacterium]
MAPKTLPPMLVAARRIHIPTNDMVPSLLGPAFTEAYNHVCAQGGKDTGPCLAVWHTPADSFTDEDAEAVVPIDRRLPETERVRVYELPGGLVASAVHHGNFDDFTQAHTALLRWIEANGYQVAGPFREIYIQHDARKLRDTITEIQFPVEKA